MPATPTLACLAGLKIPWWVEVLLVSAVIFYFLAPIVGGLALFRAGKSQRRFTVLGTLSFVVGLGYLVLTTFAAIAGGGGKVIPWIVPPLVATLLGWRAMRIRGSRNSPPPLPPQA